MLWSSYGVDKNRELLAEVGFDILQVEVLQAGDGKSEDDPDFEVEFMWVMAQKKGSPEKGTSGDKLTKPGELFV
ncbi:hypothetical protein UVI_02000010 [Ustilaginoidea virens]|nr:hypothetical protein UVI_02000010 [Ustilaginoidea virens]